MLEVPLDASCLYRLLEFFHRPCSRDCRVLSLTD
jgi:hypothetical protein